MKKLIIVVIVMVISAGVMIFSNDSGSTNVATQVASESIRGDIVELQGKSMYYRNKYNEYPIHAEDIYTLTDAEEVRSVMVFEKYYAEALGKGKGAEQYLRDNVKLINEGELKLKGIVYELASKKSKYFIDTKTGQVIVADMDLLPELGIDTGEYSVLDYSMEVIASNDSKKIMNPVVGSYKSGSSVYFYGGGAMKFARYDELSKQVVNLDDQLEGITFIPGDDSGPKDTILYIQPTTNKMAYQSGDQVIITEMRFKK